MSRAATTRLARALRSGIAFQRSQLASWGSRQRPGEASLIVCISSLLDAKRLAQLQRLLAKGRYQDGRLSAGWHARLVKNNRQLARDGGPGVAAKAEAVVRPALERSELFRAAALPRRIGPLLFSRYEEGMAYGAHVDDAVMSAADDLRSDASFTVFLSAPQDYEGGELVIESSGGEAAYKLDAGDVIVYPSTSLHRVDPVTRGTREVAVGWVQSLVRDAACREILFDLQTARQLLFQEQGKSRGFDLLSKTYSNLLRRWAET
ncbi:MAG: Fe2+-dependent dioxygenase [Kiloniellales bacterium]